MAKKSTQSVTPDQLFTTYDTDVQAAMLSIAESKKKLVKSMAELGFVKWDVIAPMAVTWAGKAYSVPVKASTSNANKGQLVLDRASDKYDAAAKAVTRIREAFVEATEPKAAEANKSEPPIEVPADIMALASAIALSLKARGVKKADAHKVASKAIADALTVAFTK